MPRKKSISGRSKGLTIESRLIRNIEKTNKALNRLEKVRAYGKYSSRKILDLANVPAFTYKRRSINKFKLSKSPSKLTTSEQLFYLKTFEKFLKSSTSSVSGIEKAKSEIKEKVRKGLSEIAEEQLTDEDVEDFYDMHYNDDYKYFTQFIDDSDIYALIREAKKYDWDENKFISGLEQLMTINIEETRNRAIRLYNKYVA